MHVNPLPTHLQNCDHSRGTRGRGDAEQRRYAQVLEYPPGSCAAAAIPVVYCLLLSVFSPYSCVLAAVPYLSVGFFDLRARRLLSMPFCCCAVA